MSHVSEWVCEYTNIVQHLCVLQMCYRGATNFAEQLLHKLHALGCPELHWFGSSVVNQRVGWVKMTSLLRKHKNLTLVKIIESLVWNLLYRISCIESPFGPASTSSLEAGGPQPASPRGPAWSASSLPPQSPPPGCHSKLIDRSAQISPP